MSETVEFASIAKARELVLGHVQPGSVVRVPLEDSLNRVLAEPVVSDMDYPPFDKATMDGYAVGGVGVRRSMGVVGQVAAGDPRGATRGLGQEGERRALGEDEAVQINTGAPIPAGAKAVVRVEDTRLSDGGATVTLNVEAVAGMNIDRRAKHVSAGTTVLEAGTRMNAGRVAVGAAAGAAEIAVYRRPRVAILVTGNELVDVSEKPSGGSIRNSNGPMLEALVRNGHAEPTDLGVVGDDKEALREQILRGLSADVLCVCGGVSMGAFDFVPEVFTACGVRTIVRKTAIKPGKPTIFGVSATGTCVFGLPGNPIGAFVAYWLLVRPAIEAREGLKHHATSAIRARLVGSCAPTHDRQSCWPARIGCDARGEVRAESLPWHGSGDPFGFSEANGLIVRPPNAPAVSEGEAVLVIPLEQF